jgi:outer membrane receptor protein involved in Fe transport
MNMYPASKKNRQVRIKNTGALALLKTATLAAVCTWLPLTNAQVAPVATEPAKTAPAATEILGQDDPLLLNEFVTTAVSRPDKSKLQSSVSVSSLPMDKLDVFTPRNSAELFRSIPGIRVESTSGEGNANLTIRGIPLADGGSRYIQIQEDNLPIVEFGDIAFGNPDVFFRPDLTIGSVEAIRGGSAAIFASNAPGGVINMISKDGKTAGGSVAVTYGVDFDQTRTEFNYGSPISEGLRFNVGGFYRSGEGARKTGTTDGGGQVKINLTKDVAGGYIRVYFKAIDDTAPTYLPAPAKVNGNSSFGDLPGYEVLKGSLYTPNLSSYEAVDSHGNFVTRRFNGIHTKVASIGAEVVVSPVEDLTITNRVRITAQSAQWGAPFPASVRTVPQAIAAYAGNFAGTTRLVYGSGPNRGQAVASDALITTVHAFDTDASDMGFAVNDLKVNKFIRFDSNNKIDFTVGYYKSQQKIVQDWTWGTFLLETKGKNANTINLANAANVALTSNGHLSYGPLDWGNFAQAKDLSYSIDAPVASITYETGDLSIDAGVRRDTIKARGKSFNAGSAPVNAAGLAVPTFNWDSADSVNYELSYTSYSAGANYRITKNLAVFGRYSFGGRVGADRLAGNAGANGTGFQAKSYYYDVKQGEVGVKYRTATLLPGQLSFNATLFTADTREPSGAELNKVNPPIDYTAKGLELEASYRNGGFDIRANATYTDAKGSTTTVKDFIPRRQAKVIYTIAPSYTIGAFSIGGSAIGTTDSYFQDPAHGTPQNGTALKMPAYATINGFVMYQITKNVSIALNVNNLLDAQGWTEGEDGSMPSAGALQITRARTITGRTTSATLKYSF